MKGNFYLIKTSYGGTYIVRVTSVWVNRFTADYVVVWDGIPDTNILKDGTFLLEELESLSKLPVIHFPAVAKPKPIQPRQKNGRFASTNIKFAQFLYKGAKDYDYHQRKVQIVREDETGIWGLDYDNNNRFKHFLFRRFYPNSYSTFTVPKGK